MCEEGEAMADGYYNKFRPQDPSRDSRTTLTITIKLQVFAFSTWKFYLHKNVLRAEQKIGKR